jgi:hypothetical protein
MDMSNMAKILALIAIVFVGFMLYKNMSEKKISPPMPYKALEINLQCLISC